MTLLGPQERTQRRSGPPPVSTLSLLLLTIGEGERFSIWRSCGRPRKTLYRPSRPEEWEVHFFWAWGAGRSGNEKFPEEG